MNIPKINNKILLIFILSLPLLVNAETQNTSMTISPYLGLSSLSNISMGTLSTKNTNSTSKSFCISSNDTSNGYYKVTFTGSGANSGFAVTSPTTSQSIPYSVKFNDQDSDSGYTNMVSNQTSASQTTGIIDSDCNTNNARLKITIEPSSVQGAIAGNDYSGTLIINLSTNA